MQIFAAILFLFAGMLDISIGVQYNLEKIKTENGD